MRSMRRHQLDGALRAGGYVDYTQRKDARTLLLCLPPQLGMEALGEIRTALAAILCLAIDAPLIDRLFGIAGLALPTVSAAE